MRTPATDLSPITYAELRALRERLDQLPRWLRHYGAWKVRLDVVYALALPLLAGRKVEFLFLASLQ